ncbi:MAG: hypothetical protein KBA31_00350 [Alphaproteobacteria bacterium]|nr:hypothetical protein [Alphaproteobacteria bacterium]
MKLLSFAPQALVLAGLVSSLGAVSAYGKAGDNGQYFLIEGLYLSKDDGDVVALTTNDGAGAFDLVTNDAIELDDGWGARAAAQFEAFGTTWQASAFVATFSDQDMLVSGLEVPLNTDTTYAKFVGGTDPTAGDPVNSDLLEAISATQDGSLYGAEFSWVKNLGGWGWRNVDFIAGVRYIHYGEELRGAAFDDPDDLTGADNDIDRFGIEIENDLVGVQIGLQAMWDITPSVAIGGTLKGGVAANFASRDRSFSADNGNFPAYTNSSDDTDLAEFAEFNPRIDIALSQSASLTIGGTVLWINETSRAVSHFQTVANSADSNLRADDDQLFYGASIGLKLALN